MRSIQTFIDQIQEVITPGSSECQHTGFDKWPAEDKSICYLRREEQEGEAYWIETDVAFVKTRQVRREFVCLGCGEETAVHTGKQIGGEDALKLKSDMDPSEIEKHRQSGGSISYNYGIDPLD